MKPEIIILNSKDKKLLRQALDKQFGVSELPDTVFFCLNKKEKVYMINKEVFDIDHDAFRVNAFGNYFGTYMTDGFRLSMEGSQLIGSLATKNVLELTKEERDLWIQGFELDKKVETKDESSYVLIKFKDDFYACGKVKEESIINYVSKARKLKKVFDPEAEDEE